MSGSSTETGGPLPAFDALLDADERVAWRLFNQAPEGAGEPIPRLLPWLEQVVHEHRDRPAVAAAGEVLTYGELNDRAEVLASWLRSVGVGPEAAVAVVATRTLNPYPALLAALKVGAAYVPLNPNDPLDRLASMLEDCEAVVVLSDWLSATKLQTLTTRVTTCAVTDSSEAVDGWEDWSDQCGDDDAVEMPEEGHDDRSTGDTVAYVVYTSGTTGRPKGVRVSEASLLNLTQWFHDRHGVTSDDRVAQNAPLTFDPSVQQIFPAWTAGACLVVMPEEAMLDAHDLLVWLRGEAITHFDIVTSHWLHLLDAAIADPALRDLPHLRWTIVGGESFSYQHTRQWYEVVQSPGRLNNVYGPTEATVNATEFVVDPERSTGKVPIGRPLPNYRLYVLDASGSLCPMGVQGDLYIAGLGLAQGYCSVEATQRAWSEHRVLDGQTDRMYKTGDLARLVRDITGDAVLEFCGREDRQVKISGYRMELEEIEMAAKSCGGVRDAAVITVGQPPDQLACFIVGDVASPEVVRRELATRLPTHMVPHRVVRIAGMPFTPSGKVDRSQLLDQLAQWRSPRSTPSELMSETERIIADIFSEALRVPVTSSKDDFYELGGSSLLALQVAGRLREAGLSLRATDLLRFSTVEGLAASVIGG